MKTIDPNLNMDCIRIAANTPGRLYWTVRLLKGLMMFRDLDLDKDRPQIITELKAGHNHSPQWLFWGMNITDKDLEQLYDDAVKWIKEVEQ